MAHLFHKSPQGRKLKGRNPIEHKKKKKKADKNEQNKNRDINEN